MDKKTITFTERLFHILKNFITDYLIGSSIYLNTCFSLSSSKNITDTIRILWLAIFFIIFHLTLSKYLPDVEVCGKYTKQIRFIFRIIFIILYIVGYGFNIVHF